MKRGLVLGKFMPLHMGHVELINYAENNCDELIVWVCVSSEELMQAELRLNWVNKTFKSRSKIKPILFKYDEKKLPNSSESSIEISRKWVQAIRQNLPEIHAIFSKEKYGDYVADILGIEHKMYPGTKNISATQIRNNPLKHWEYLSDAVKSYYFKKIVILGTESTGKSTLAKKLADYFNSDFVPEAGRDIVENSNECSWNDLERIATSHAQNIKALEANKNKILFIDTDINITKSYANFFFNRDLVVADWVVELNQADLYLYLWNDVEHIQDGTRLNKNDRDLLHQSHIETLEANNISYTLIQGSWDERFSHSVNIIEKAFGIKKQGSIFHPI